jgi:hypothetical protein
MANEVKTKQRDLLARVFIGLIILVMLVTAGILLLRTTFENMYQLSADWSGEQIHVYSMSDGPWLVTHLVAYQTNGYYWRAIAQLPSPVTITDSAGHYFSRQEIDKLQWVDTKGEKEAPPAVGENVGVMYIIPAESRRPIGGTTKR